MNKREFLSLLYDHLSVLPPEERDELMEDFEVHFTFAEQNGKSESEIVRELGDPAELAKEAIGERNVHPPDPVYWMNPEAAASVPVAPSDNLKSRKSRGGFASAMVYTGLFFLNLIPVPLLLSFWAVVVSLAVSSAVCLISPVLLGLEHLVHGNVKPIQWYSSIAFVGFGIFLMLLSRYLISIMAKVSVSYWKWNYQLAKGVKANEQ